MLGKETLFFRCGRPGRNDTDCRDDQTYRPHRAVNGHVINLSKPKEFLSLVVRARSPRPIRV
jgi:hypothetical protein